MKKFLVVTEKGWSPSEDNVIQLHKLCHDLNTAGSISYITHQRGNPNLNTPFLGDLEKSIDCDDPSKNKILTEDFLNDFIVIYPEHLTPRIFNNNSKNNVYALQFYNKNAFSVKQNSEVINIRKKDIIQPLYFNLTKFYHFLPLMNKKVYIKNVHIQPQYINLNTFQDLKKERKGQAYIQKKGVIKIYKHSKDAVFLDPFLHDWSLLSEIFNKIETLYCYDLRTIWPVLAALCGCKVIVVPNMTDSSECKGSTIYRNSWDLFKYGIAFTDSADEINHAKDTLHLVYDNVLNYCDNVSLKEVKHFIGICEEYFNVK